MNNPARRFLIAGTLLSATALAGCASQGKYNDLQSQYQTLQKQNQDLTAQVAAQQAQVSRLQGAIKYTVNSDLLFAPGSWKMSAQGQQVIAKMAKNLVPAQSKLVVNRYTDNAPIGPGLMREGVTTNEALSQKRAETVMQFLVSQGVQSNMIAAQGHGDSDPIASNASPAGRAQNRRVEITLANA
jgi:outer membrane protein OmpA-like peptidoglycan-associated protein